MKYVTLKNLASIEGDQASTKEDALKHFAEATELDSMDPTLWYQIGNLALDANRLTLARQVDLHFGSSLTLFRFMNVRST